MDLSGLGRLELSRPEGLALLDWLGLGQPEFGAIKARELAPLCRRRLWGVARNAEPRMRELTRALLAVAEGAGEGMVLFG
jgi:hypothetical protein